MTINKKRLAQLEHMLLNLDKYFKQPSFNLGAWVFRSNPPKQKDGKFVSFVKRLFRVKVTHSCGTTACACGYAGGWKVFNDQGFSLDENHTPIYKAVDRVHEGWYAVQAFFGLSLEQAVYLFSRSSYIDTEPTVGDVADRIRKTHLS